MKTVKTLFFAGAVFAAAHCGNTGIYDEATTTYYRIVRSGLNEWYPLNGNLSSRVGGATGSATGSYLAGSNRNGENNKSVCVSAASFTFANTTIGAVPFTISVWMKFNAVPAGTNIIFEKGVGCTTYNGLRIQQTASTALQLDHGSCGGAPGFLTTNIVTANDWIYFAFAYGGGTGNFYTGTYGSSLVNVGSTPAKDYAQHTNPLQIFSGANVNVCLDDLLHYNRVLSAAEVKQNFLSVE